MVEEYKVKYALVAILPWKDWLAFGDERLRLSHDAPFLDDWQMSGDLNNNNNKNDNF